MGEHYDSDSVGHLEPGPAVRFLATLAAGGSARELGVGTERLALPLAATGVPVTGIDASTAMLQRLDARIGGLPVDAQRGDMADFHSPRPVASVYVAASTLFLLGSADRQVSCFHATAAALTSDGYFVVEAALPHTVVTGQQIIARHIDDDHVRLTVQTHDSVNQQVLSQELHLHTDGTWRMLPSCTRYAGPAELDLMGQLAGLRLHARYSGWGQRPFTAANTRHVSVYTRAESG